MQLSCCGPNLTLAGGACFNEERTHRYALWRNWDTGLPMMTAIMLNPSVADQNVLDPTLTRVQTFARDWGFGGMLIVNAFSLIATKPRELRGVELRSAQNDAHIHSAIASAGRIMLGWGTLIGRPDLSWRLPEIYALLKSPEREILAWKLTKAGYPSHPLYLRADIVPVEYSWT